MSTQQTSPSRVWYWVAGTLAVASVVWLVVTLVFGFSSLGRHVDDFQRVSLPGQGEVSLTEPGSYVLYYEGPGAPDSSFPGFSASLVPVDGDAEVPISDYDGSLTYDVSGHSGVALGSFQIDNPGRFLLRTESEAEGTQAKVAVGQSIAGELVRAVVLALVGTLVLFFSGAALAVVVAIRRRRARRLLDAPSTNGGMAARAAGSQGWFADPSERHMLRYWDGTRWTEHVSDGGTQAIDPMPQPMGGL
jgi:Protein of unknown function (DUF2510)